MSFAPFNLLRKRIQVHTRDLIYAIIDYSHAQEEYWKRVPWLALHADGRDGYSDHAARAYKFGFWPVSSSGGYYTVYVDLATGDLVSSASTPSEIKTARDAYILPLAKSLESLNAVALCESLEARINREVRPYMSKNAEELAEWHRTQVETYRVEKIYTRQKKLTTE